MVKIEETEEDAEPKHSTRASTSSLTSPPTAAKPLAPPPDSPDTVSSISSDHTFHGFSPLKENLPTASPSPSPPIHPVENSLSPVLAPAPAMAAAMASRFVRDQAESVTKTESNAETGFAETGVDARRGEGVAANRVRKPVGVLRRGNRTRTVKRIGLGLRVCEFVVCLISFSVLAADKHRGWALDSFDRYIEFRYSLSVNVIGFAYSGLQGLDLLHQLTTGKDLSQSQIRYCFDFAMDQMLAYLLLSASSSAFTRVDDWISNWGQDKFPSMASASVGVSFLAFVAFALSSLISGYILCTHRFT